MSDFEDRLQAWGSAEAAAAGPPPALRPRRSRSWAPLAAAAAVVVLVGSAVLASGLGGSRNRSIPATTPAPLPVAEVPWANLPPTYPSASPSPTPAIDYSVRRCQAADLRANADDPGQGATGWWVEWWTLTNRSSTKCRLEGQLEAMSGVVNGARRQITLKRGASGWLSGIPVYPAVLNPGATGTLGVAYYPRCDAGPPTFPNTYTAVDLTIQGGVLRLVGGHAVLALGCDPPTAGISPTALGRQPDYTQPTSPPTSGLTASLDLPASVQAGSLLRYVLTLSNPTSAAIAFDQCLVFLQRFDGTEGKDAHALNCAAAHPVPAGGSETFAMELPIPADLAPGPQVLRWDSGPDGPSAQATVTITAA